METIRSLLGFSQTQQSRFQLHDEETGSTPRGPMPNLKDLTPWEFFFFSWYTPLLQLGLQRPLQLKDIWTLRPEHSAATLASPVKTLSSAWKIFRGSALYSMYFRCGVYRLLTELFSMGTPFLLNQLMLCIGDKNSMIAKAGHHTDHEGYILACFMLVTAVCQSVTLNQYIGLCFESGAHARSVTMYLVSEKALKLSPSAIQDISTGQLINLMSKDAAKIQEFMLFGHNLWSGPLTAIWVISALFIVLGWSASAGVFLTIILVPIQSVNARYSAKFRKETMKHSDERLKVLGGVLEGIRLIKLSAWEDEVERHLSAVRARELESTRKSTYLMALNRALMDASPVIIALVTFVMHSWAGEPLTADEAFTALALFNLLGHPFHIIPKSISLFTELRVTLHRLETLLGLPDKPPLVVEPLHMAGWAGPVLSLADVSVGWPIGKTNIMPGGDTKKDKAGGGGGGGGSRSFSSSSQLPDAGGGGGGGKSSSSQLPSAEGGGTKVVLRGVQLEVRPGELLVVVGRVGSGKSTLVAGMVGEAPVLQGEVKIMGRGVAYLPQAPWVRNGTVRDNITMGAAPADVDEPWLHEVMAACAMAEDLAVWPNGDATLVGERGIALSGGQKARLALARALYHGAKTADVFVLDCPLASLDSRTAMAVYRDVVLERICGAGKACVMASNSGWMLDLPADDLGGAGTAAAAAAERMTVAVLHEGGCRTGKYRELLASGLDLQTILESTATAPDAALKPAPDKAGKGGKGGKDGKANGGGGGAGGGKKGGGIAEEKRDTGKVKWQVYRDYVAAATEWRTALFFACAVLSQFLMIWKDVVLSNWSGSTAPAAPSAGEEGGGVAMTTPPPGAGTPVKARVDYLSVYTMFCVAAIVMAAFRSVALAMGCLYASQHLHREMLVRVLAAPLRFFEKTPVGQVTNRFSSDTDSLDWSLPTAIAMFMDTILVLIGCILLLLAKAPYLCIPFAGLAVVYEWVQRTYNRSATELKRLDGMTKSPVLTNFSQTLDGMATIRAMRIEQHLLAATVEAINLNTGTYLTWAHSNRWLGVRLDLIGALVTLCAALVAVQQRSFGEVGLLLTYAVIVTRCMAASVRGSTQMEVQFSAVERVKHYIALEPEEDVPAAEAVEPGPGWPTAGRIEWRGVVARYDAGLDPVLRDVTLDVPAGTCVGLCGRTGAGKSSLLLALLRVLRCEQGSVLVDGVNVGGVRLARLRRSVAVIPQDPVHIASTVREAIDPWGRIGDSKLLAAMEQVGLRGAAADEPMELDTELKAGAANLSVGQRQLVCLARALVSDSKVLLLDEATAHVDEKTAARLRQVVLSLRGRRTVIVIAHRLEDVAVCDTVAVLGAGRLVECGPPLTLLDSPAGAADGAGAFAAMAAELGSAVEARIRALAAEAMSARPAA